MVDIVICKRPGDRAIVMGETDEGKKYIEKRMIHTAGLVWVTHEVIEDLIEEFKKGGMQVEVI